MTILGEQFVFSVPTEIRDYPEWHRGRPRYGVWIIPIEAAEVVDYLTDLRQRLSDILHPSPRRQPHLTLFVCGFEQTHAEWDDDFTPGQSEAQIASLRGNEGHPYSLPLLPPDSFATAIHLPVLDPSSRLSTWRRHLASAGREIRQSPYRPHITIGLYRRQVPAAEIRERLAQLPQPPSALPVAALCYATYESGDQFGPLTTHFEFPLDTSSTPATL